MSVSPIRLARPALGRSVALLSAASVLALATAARAADPAPQDASVSEIVVTGSHIAGTPKDGVMPVLVVNQKELRDEGSPSNVDLIKTLPIIGATIAGDANP